MTPEDPDTDYYCAQISWKLVRIVEAMYEGDLVNAGVEIERLEAYAEAVLGEEEETPRARYRQLYTLCLRWLYQANALIIMQVNGMRVPQVASCADVARAALRLIS